MDTMNIALPPEMKDFVREEVAQHGYSSASEYIRDLIRQAQQKKVDSRLEALLIEGLESGPAVPWTKNDLSKMKRELRQRWSKKSVA